MLSAAIAVATLALGAPSALIGPLDAAPAAESTTIAPQPTTVAAMSSSDGATATTPPTVPPDDTVNEFLPEERGLGDCLGAVERPGCGSKARGGWRQGLVFLALVLGLAFIGWRIVRSARRRPTTEDATPG